MNKGTRNSFQYLFLSPWICRK